MRTLIFFKRYFLDFYESLNPKTREKVEYVLFILQNQANVSANFVKHITNSDGIYEVRISIGSNEYRILFFFESGSLIEGGKIVVLGNGFLKKDNRDYKKAVRLAEEIKAQYFEDKEKSEPSSDNEPNTASNERQP